MRRRLPNALVLVRIALIPIIIGLVLAAESRAGLRLLATVLAVVASVTDLLDGYLARRWDVTSMLGAFLDTTADKLLVSGLLVALVAVGHASPWAAFIIIARELVVMGLRGLAAMDGTFIPPSIWGKIKATLQFIAIPMAIARLPVELAGLYLDEWAMWLAALAALLSGWDYFRGFWLLHPDRAEA
ncbi:MAG: CDP-diacylglycerol--glycerol-3-phosphate 3-phosphatidyltransferase [Caldilineae bacterium]|nr:CDP-diacylglycerol--glycerol-3-phosphate 3-phosphatidyltransferase [Chloroflexota bacterium]MCB9177502.1 CDP-diacylglycerol--glycerol-3-phosphate 3-phosphatidyltransferase [Caldilineae bacterium]